MSNVIPFTPSRRENPAPAAVAPDVDDSELDIRLWELAMSGQRSSLEYQHVSASISRRVSHWDAVRRLPA